MEPLVFAVGRGAMDGFPCDPTLVKKKVLKKGLKKEPA